MKAKALCVLGKIAIASGMHRTVETRIAVPNASLVIAVRSNGVTYSLSTTEQVASMLMD
jgi:hypothetical protein